jgi:hypothetical protein
MSPKSQSADQSWSCLKNTKDCLRKSSQPPHQPKHPSSMTPSHKQSAKSQAKANPTHRSTPSPATPSTKISNNSTTWHNLLLMQTTNLRMQPTSPTEQRSKQIALTEEKEMQTLQDLKQEPSWLLWLQPEAWKNNALPPKRKRKR